MLLDEVRDAVAAVEVRGDLGVEVTSVTHDSRKVTAGALFCCVPGSTTDGHDHAPAAVASGAAALLVERFVDVAAPQVRVASVRTEMAPAAAAVYGRPSTRLRLIGVTGTNGKTTTTYLLEAMADAAGLRSGVIGTVETRLAGVPVPAVHTTPEAPELQSLLARMVDAGVEVAAIEVSSHALVQHRVDAARFTAACFTNLSHDHLDYHGDIDSYFEAKALLFDPERTAVAALNLDSPHGAELARRAEASGLPAVGYGIEAQAEVRGEDLRMDAFGIRFRLVTPWGTGEVNSPLVGRFNVENLLGAAATALAAGLEFDPVVAGASAPVVVPGRMERVDAGQPFAVIVDYAHTPGGLEAVLGAGRAAAEGSGGRLLLVFGAGGDRDRAKRPVMGSVSAAMADQMWVTSDNPRSEDPVAIIDEILAGVPVGAHAATHIQPDRRAAIAAVLAAAREGDVVVVAGKGHETGQTAGGVTAPFDDRLVAREELEKLTRSTDCGHPA